MKFSARTSRHVGIAMTISHLAVILAPYQMASAVGPGPGPDDGWKPPAIVHSKSARPNRPTPVTPPDMNPLLPAQPSAEHLHHHRALSVPLVSRAGADAGDSGRGAMAATLNAYAASADQPTHQRLPHLMSFLAGNPKSPYAATLWLEVATRADASGDFKTALKASRSAWDLSKSATPAGADQDTVALAERALARLALLQVRTGQKAALQALLAEVAARPPHSISGAALGEAKVALAWWSTDPVAGALCGITAYDCVAEKIGAPSLEKYPTTLWGDSIEEQAEQKRAEGELVQLGLSAAQLLGRISKTGGQFRLVRRTQGTAIPIPSVAHLVFGSDVDGGHYSALVDKDGNRTRVEDAHLRFQTWMEDTVLNSQLSGYFLVPQDAVLGDTFVNATNEQAKTVFGRVSCPNGREPEDDCEKGGCGCGMAVYSISQFLPGVRLFDQPVTYTPAYGPGVGFGLNYRQVRIHSDSVLDDVSSMSNLGPNWSHSFLSYVRAESGESLPASTDLRLVSSGGGIKNYRWTGLTWAARASSAAKITWLAAASGGPGYRVTSTDGSYSDYTQPDAPTPTRYFLKRIVNAQAQAVTLSYDASYRLAQITDATGKITSLGYLGTDKKIASITDPFSRSASFTYHPNGVLASITDTLGITSSFTYTNGLADEIATLTTPDGTTTFLMEGTPSTGYLEDWSVTVTDPHGDVEKVESFYESAEAPSLQDELTQHRPPASISVGATLTPFYTPDTVNGTDHFHVSFHWTKKYWGEYQKALIANNALGIATDSRAFAEATLWLMATTAAVSYSVPTPLATKRPGEAMNWYNYPGQGATTAFAVGTDNQPIRTARQIENTTGVNTWAMTQQTYNALGLPLIRTDELGHKTQSVYFATAYTNHITWGTPVINRDVAYEQVWNGSAWNNTRTYGKYVNGLPGTITEASGKVTTYTRNAKQQITEVAISKAGSTNVEKTRYTFDADGQGVPDSQPGYLMKVEQTTDAQGTIWATISQMTYDSQGRKATETDASGYTRSFDYDDFDRVTLITYPDSTTEQFSYLHGLGNDPNSPGLDLTAQKDRAGRWTRFVYDEVRRLVMTITPDNLTTKNAWCRCGKLWRLTDKAGRVTEWKRDILGRVYEKVMPDTTTKTTYSFQPRSGRLSTMTRPNQQGTGTPTVTYSYNLDGTLQKEDFLGTDADATYTYDALDRLLTVVDSTGTHTNAYNALPAAAATGTLAGAGKLLTYDSPLGNAKTTYLYDWQDRLATTDLKNQATTPVSLRAQTSTWDPLGRSNTVTNALGTFAFGYTTNLARPDTLTNQNNIVTSYAYFPNTAAGTKAQRLQSITHSRFGLQYSKHSFDYDPAGRITAWNQEASGLATVNHAYDYNLTDELTTDAKTDTASGNVLAKDLWAYDNAGNWMSKGSATDMSTRTHNSLNQLTKIGGAGSTVIAGKVNEIADVTVNTQPAVVLTDPAGGYRFSKKIDLAEGQNSITVQAIDKDNPPNTTTQNYQLSVGGLSRSFTYDANGNLLTDGQRTLTWDAKNRLKTVTKAGTTARWDYDYQDRRVKEYQYAAGGTVPAYPSKAFVWDGTDLIQERSVTSPTDLTAGGTTTRTHFFGGFMEGNIAQTTVTKYQTLTDHLGNVRDIIANNISPQDLNIVVARYDYTAFQGPVKLFSNLTNDASLLTIGRYYHHAASGLELALYRAYDPELGRWISEDPIEERGGVNLYEFVNNIPLLRVDNLGLVPYSDTMVAVGVTRCRCWCHVSGNTVPLVVPRAVFYAMRAEIYSRFILNCQLDYLGEPQVHFWCSRLDDLYAFFGTP